MPLGRGALLVKDFQPKILAGMAALIEETTIVNRCLKEDTYEKRLKDGRLLVWRGLQF
jgi:hypothetical protein